MYRKISIQWWRFWMAGEGLSVKTGRALSLCALTGLAAGLAAAGFYWLLESARYYLMEGLAHYAPPLAAGETALYPVVCHAERLRWALLALPALGAAAGALLVKFFAPTAGGHGTDAAIHAYHRDEGRIPFAVIPVKAVASALVIGSGGSAGCEGPVTQIGAGCGSALAGLLKLDAAERRILMAAGLAAGVGALFRAPLAGAIFAAEIFYSGLDIEYEIMMPSLVASTVAYTVFALFFGWQPLFIMPEYTFEDPLKLLPYLLLALVVALGAKFYILVFRQVESASRAWQVPAWVKPGIGGLLTGLIGVFLPQVLGSGYGIIQQALAVNSPLAERFGGLSLGLLLLIFFGKIFATAFTVASGGSGGVFGPALVSGAALGAATGVALTRLFPGLDLNPGAFALVGMAGFLAASVRVPIAAIIMVSEITGNHSLLLPSMWVCGVAYWLGNGWTIYRSQVRTRDCSPAHMR
ncbi:MAG TPA: chloride channel protein [Kiritimatiellia bacterium]|jgi:CIC family chloride channel protein|nr:chloride channel protein [Kiritimatiellia bacterium]HPO37140.1 chloride channel protein [Kiritimatiellia bacterium]HQA38499.1 chloride channel protein [Kiritimatiellia bacterium]HQL51803.1 chloride channel protein [Kiritimatiellia bacterium]HQQ90594.1 chloride channel protein [Kiritimatiellia bacterium]